MFCNTFYCPYAKYILKDIEAVCSLLSSADKSKKKVALIPCIIKKIFYKHCMDYFLVVDKQNASYALQNYFIYTVFSSGRNLMLVVHFVIIGIYSNHICKKKYPYRLTFTLFLVAFYQSRFFEGYVEGMWEMQILILNPFVLFMSY